MPDPAVSVIVPAYKVTAYIEETLESIFAQTFQDFEVIVINDGCPDTANLERVLAPHRDRIVYLKQENAGPAVARNAGLRAARAPLIALLDSDDQWLPHYLELQMRVLRENPTADLVYGDAIFFGDPQSEGRRSMELSPSRGEANFIALIRQDCNVVVSVLAKRAAIERAGGFDPRVRGTEDFDLWVRFVKSGGRIVYHNEPVMRYRKRPDSLSSNHLPMIDSHLQCLGQYLNELDLSPEERAEVEEKITRVKAARNYFAGLAAARSGDSKRAIQMLGQSGNHRNPRKTSLLIWGLRCAPTLVRYVMQRRAQ